MAGFGAKVKDSNTLYWLTDKKEIRKGEELYAVGREATAEESGLMSAADKAKLDAMAVSTTGNLTAVDATILLEDAGAGSKTIRVGISQVPGNMLSVQEDGLFVSADGLEGEIAQLQESVDTLNGTGVGSVKQTAEEAASAAIDAFANEISDDGVVNTVKELVDYVAEHAPEAAEMAADIAKAHAIIDSLPDEMMSEITSVSRTADTNVAQIRLSIKQPDGTYSTSQEHGVLTLIPAGHGVDGIDGAGLMSLADKEKLDSIDTSALAEMAQSFVWGAM